MSATEEILKEFAPVTPQQWESVFLKEVKQEQLSMHASYLGFELRPFYTAEPAHAGQAQLVQRLSVKKDEAWYINRHVNINQPAAAGEKILASLGKGVSSLTLEGELADKNQAQALLKEVMAVYVEINLQAKDPVKAAQVYLDWCNLTQTDTGKIFGAVYYDPLGEALKNGGWKTSREEDLRISQDLYNVLAPTRLSCITVDASVYHYAGASLAQTIGYALAHALEYIHWFKSHGIAPAAAVDRIVFKWPVGTAFFAEMSALRALRLAWNQLCAHITGDHTRLYRACIHAHTSVFTWSVADMYNNLLRATTQAMSAIAGGADHVEVKPYNVVSTYANDFSERLAANIQLLLREESFFDKVTDPAAGSYLVESLTHQLYEQSLELVKQAEKTGGLLALAEKGILQQDLAAGYEKMKALVEKGEIKILGTNLYPDKNEDQQKIPRHNLFDFSPSGTSFAPIVLHRLAAEVEQPQKK